MVREFKLPDVGEGLTEAEIVSWLVEVGDTVTEDQPVAEVETDKAVVEVPSPVNGTVREILAEEGEMVPVGDVIITFDVGAKPDGKAAKATEGTGEAAVKSDTEVESAVEQVDTDGESGGTASKGGRTFAAPSARRLARELDVGIAAVEGSGPGGRVTEQDICAHAESGSENEEADEPVASTTPSSIETASREQTLAAPATRKLAAEEGVDIDDVPTDETRDGQAFVAPEQVTQYAEAQQADAQAVQTEVAESGSSTELTAEGEVEREPYSGIRQTIGQAMERSKYTAPHVTHHDQVVVEDLVKTRERLKLRAEKSGIKLTYMPFIVKAVVAALKQHPVLNSQLNEDDEEILVKHYYNVGIAVATDAGLIVPVVKNADEKDMLTIASDADELAEKARNRSISQEEMEDGTFTITNFGAIGGEYATPIINYPETAILGLGELKQRPVVEDGEVVAKHTIPLSLSIDHRIIDGADIAQFANTLIEYLNNPELLLLE